jgi:hypothetical protein
MEYENKNASANQKENLTSPDKVKTEELNSESKRNTGANAEAKSEYIPHLHNKHEGLVFSESQAGGHPGTIIHKHDKIYKQAKKSEFKMYEFLYSEQCPEDLKDLKAFLPKYMGTDQINGEEFLILENLHLGYEHPNLLDVKIGRRTWKLDADPKKVENQKKKNLQSINKHFGFRITGAVIRDKAGTLLEAIKKPISDRFFTKENLNEYLIKTVSYEGVFQRRLVEEIVFETEKLLEFFNKQKSKIFIASSVYYVIGKNHKVQTRYIDIAHPEDSEGKVDENFIEGIEGLIGVWKSLLN